MPYSIPELNQLSQAEFTQALGTIFEDSAWIAEAAWSKRPFLDRITLYQALVDVVAASSQQAQLSLIRAHPDLATKTRMAEASIQEQAGVGLDRLSPKEYGQFNRLNAAYKEKFGFPFIIAVKNHNKDSILAAFEQRLNNDSTTEQQQALKEIAAIAYFRLDATVIGDRSSPEANPKPIPD